MAFGDCHESRNPLVRYLLLTILHAVLAVLPFTNRMNDATTNEIKLCKAVF